MTMPNAKLKGYIADQCDLVVIALWEWPLRTQKDKFPHLLI